MAEIQLYAFAGDIIQLSGTSKTGRVLDWASQIPIDQREFSQTHYAIQPVGPDGKDLGQVVFWPMNGVMMIKRRVRPEVRPDPEFDVRF